MGMVLIFPIMLAILSTRWCHANIAGTSDDSCYMLECPAGSFKVDVCKNGSNKCRQCPNQAFTAIPNTLPKCLPCVPCGSYQVEIESCSSTSNVKCDCISGYHKINGDDSQEGIHCQPCLCETCEGSKYTDRYSPNQRCEACKRQECLQDSKCQKLCTPTVNQTVNASGMTTSQMLTTNFPTTSKPADEGSSWMLIVVALVTLVVLFWLLLLYICFIRYPLGGNKKKQVEPGGKDIESNGCDLCSVDEEATEDLIVSLYGESHRHPGSSPTTPTGHILEESPMMTLHHNLAKLDHPPCINARLLDIEHKAARQEMHWPAIVLYAIIKEVPLRRWKEFLRLLAVSDQQMERVEMEAGLGLGSVERQYQMLRLWSQRSSASLGDVFSALHYMDLSGCAQLLQDSLKKMQWKEELIQDFTAC